MNANSKTDLIVILYYICIVYRDYVMISCLIEAKTFHCRVEK